MDALATEVDGYTILIEIKEPDVSVPTTTEEIPPVARGDKLDRTVDRLDQLGGSIAAVTRRLYENVQKADELMPDELTLEFGISLSGEMGVPLVSKASGEATLTVTATWKNKSNSQEGEPAPRGR